MIQWNQHIILLPKSDHDTMHNGHSMKEFDSEKVYMQIEIVCSV